MNFIVPRYEHFTLNINNVILYQQWIIYEYP